MVKDLIYFGRKLKNILNVQVFVKPIIKYLMTQINIIICNTEATNPIQPNEIKKSIIQLTNNLKHPLCFTGPFVKLLNIYFTKGICPEYIIVLSLFVFVSLNI